MSQERTQTQMLNFIRQLRAEIATLKESNTSLKDSLDYTEMELFFCRIDLDRAQEELRQAQASLAVTPRL